MGRKKKRGWGLRGSHASQDLLFSYPLDQVSSSQMCAHCLKSHQPAQAERLSVQTRTGQLFTFSSLFAAAKSSVYKRGCCLRRQVLSLKFLPMRTNLTSTLPNPSPSHAAIAGSLLQVRSLHKMICKIQNQNGNEAAIPFPPAQTLRVFPDSSCTAAEPHQLP